MTAAQEELRRLESLLKIEKEADLESYRQKILQTTGDSKIKNGVSWFPVRALQNYFTQGEKPVITIERKSHQGKPHSFQSGKLVVFYSIISPRYYSNGVVNNVSEDQMTITLNTDELPDWVEEGSLGVDLLFDESTYREMGRALRHVIKADGDNRVADLREILLGKRPAVFDQNQEYNHPVLNTSQRQAIERMLSARDLGIIHGPPGTGKTTTIIHLVIELLKREKQLLVCAPSNTAVDLIVERLRNEKVDVLRIGHPARVSDDQLGSTLDARISSHPYYSDLKRVKKKAEEYFKLAGKYKRNYGTQERQQRKLIYNEAKKLRADAQQLEFYIQNEVVNTAQVITATLTGAASQALAGKTFSTVIIDEAAQALEPACWIPIMRSNRVIFAGDHLQLPPTIKSMEAAKEGLGNTLFEKAIACNNADSILQVQYRMLPSIMDFSNQHFYQGKLRAEEHIRQKYPWLEPVTFIDTSGYGAAEVMDPETLSKYNETEVEVLHKQMMQDLDMIGIENFINGYWTIGVITPYRAQTEKIRELLKSDPFYEPVLSRIQVNTIDGFQGQERDMIYISLVRANEKNEIGFLRDARRLNVALTRARQRLCVIGDGATLGGDSFFSKLLQYYENKGFLKSIFEIV